MPSLRPMLAALMIIYTSLQLIEPDQKVRQEAPAVALRVTIVVFQVNHVLSVPIAADSSMGFAETPMTASHN